MERMLDGFRNESIEQAGKPEFFWASQRTRIAARLRQPETHRGLGWAATLAAVTALVVLMATPTTHQTVAPRVQPEGQVATTQRNVDDEALLKQIEDTTNTSVPDALAPADILASEMDRGLEGASKKK